MAAEENEMSGLEREDPSNERMMNQDQIQEKKIEDYYESFSKKSFIETLQFQKDNFIECPAEDENVHPLTGKKRTRRDKLIALTLFFMR